MSAAGNGRAAEPDALAEAISGLSRQNSVYRRTMAACDRLADAAVQGADAAELTRIFAEAAGKTVVLLDPEFRLQHQAAGESGADPVRWDPGDASVGRLLRMLASERRPLRVPPVPGSALACGCLATPVTVSDTVLGYLLVLGEAAEDADDVDLIVTSYAATLFALTLARTRTSMELGLRYRGAIVDSLVSGHFLDSQDALRKARILGVADGQPFRVAVARPGGATAPRLDEREVADGLPGLDCAFTIRGPELVMLLPEEEPAGTPRRLLRQRAGPAAFTCGISEPARLPEMAPEALRQAQQAIDMGIRIGRAGETISYSDLGIHRLLLQVGDLHTLWQFAVDVLGPLIEYEASHKADLVSTLSVYLNQRESLKQTARILRVHANTVAYRIQRIEQITALDLTNPDQRLSAHVAAKIIESQRTGGRS